MTRQDNSTLHSLRHTRDLLYELVSRDFKLRYKRSVLGIAWSLLNPISQFLVFYFVFGLLLRQDADTFPVFLFTGILVWTWFQSSLLTAASVVPDNPALIRQPGFRPASLPLVAVLANLMNFLLALPIALVVLVATGRPVTLALLALPAIIAVQFVMTLSLAYFFAALQVRYRDVQYLLGIALLLGFYLSPVFYDIELIPSRYQWLYGLNPLVHVLDGYRDILIRGRLPNPLPLLVVTGGSLLILTATYSLFQSASKNFVEEM